MAAFQPALSGTVRLSGRPVDEYTPEERARMVSVVLTSSAHLHGLTVFELVGLGRSPYTGFWGRLTAEDKKVVNDALAAVGVSEYAERLINTLSDGERQKVMIAKALAQQTPVVLLDEPTAFLDFSSKVEVMRLLHRMAHEMDKTVLLSTHDLSLALQLADMVWLLRSGEPLVDGCPEDLALNGSLQRFFPARGVEFDIHSGLFRPAMQCSRTIKVQGEGTRREMLDKALSRIGIQSVEKTDSNMFISVESDTFTLHHSPDSAQTFNTVQSLLAQIAQ
jgi:iron complex transport system ATP-binding protein